MYPVYQADFSRKEVLIRQTSAVVNWKLHCYNLIMNKSYSQLSYFIQSSVLLNQGKVYFAYDTPTGHPLHDLLRLLLTTENYEAIRFLIQVCYTAGLEEEYLNLYSNINEFLLSNCIPNMETLELCTLVNQLRTEIKVLEGQYFQQSAQRLEAYVTALCRHHGIVAPKPLHPSERVHLFNKV